MQRFAFASLSLTCGLAEEATYVKGELGSNSCPAGSTKVRDSNECQAASNSFGFTWGSEFEKDGMPDGCLFYWDGSTATVYSNTAASGTAQESSAPICKQGSGPSPPSPPPSPKPPSPPPPGQTTGQMTWDGKERQWSMYVPSSAPTGLIVVLHPATADAIGSVCTTYTGQVSAETGAIVVCPAALSRPGVKSGSDGACWKAWGHYGTCESTDEDSEDVDFLAAMIQKIKQDHSVSEGRTIMSGMSNGGSMAYRFNCEKSEVIDGLVIQSQAFLDPWVGFYDYVNNVVPTGTPQCNPQFKRPFYSDIGTVDEYYGNDVIPGFRGFPAWQTYSTEVLGCTGDMKTTPEGPTMPQGPTTCYEYESCPSMNRYCNVTGMHHDAAGLATILPKAFSDFFGGQIVV